MIDIVAAAELAELRQSSANGRCETARRLIRAESDLFLW